MTAPNFDLRHNDEPVCPHCGAKDMDAWELELGDDQDTVTDCGSCEGMYVVTAHVRVTYSTEATTEREEKLKEANVEIKRRENIVRFLGRCNADADALAPHREAIVNAQALIAKLESEAVQ